MIVKDKKIMLNMKKENMIMRLMKEMILNKEEIDS
jgi:hypothetical protein